MAAVLASGSGAALSYRSGAHHLGIRRTDRRLIEVTTTHHRRARPGIQLHYDRLQPDEVTTHDGIPVTTASRTLLDLASVLDRHRLERAINQAEILNLLDAKELEQLLSRHPRRRGIAALRAIVGADLSGITREELEERFARFSAGARLPPPQHNVEMHVGGHWIEADCVWRDQRVIVELDGRATHDTRAAFEQDRKRDRELQVRGWRVVRVTWRHLHDEPASLAADLRRLLTCGSEPVAIAG